MVSPRECTYMDSLLKKNDWVLVGVMLAMGLVGIGASAVMNLPNTPSLAPLLSRSETCYQVHFEPHALNPQDPQACFATKEEADQAIHQEANRVFEAAFHHVFESLQKEQS